MCMRVSSIPLGHLVLLITLKILYLKFSSQPFPVFRHDTSPTLRFDSQKIAIPLVTVVYRQTNKEKKRKKKTRKIKRQPRKYVLHNKYATKTTQMRPKSSTLDLFYMCVCIVTVPLSTCYFQQ